ALTREGPGMAAEGNKDKAEAALGIIGVGGLAGFVVEGLRRAGDKRAILVSPRGAATGAALAARFGARVMADNQSVIETAGIVLVATPPAETLACLRALRWRPGQAEQCRGPRHLPHPALSRPCRSQGASVGPGPCLRAGGRARLRCRHGAG